MTLKNEPLNTVDTADISPELRPSDPPDPVERMGLDMAEAKKNGPAAGTRIGEGGVLGLRVRVFQAPKRDEKFDSCADAADASPERGLVAVADGVTDTLRAGAWAKRLTRRFVTDPPLVLSEERFVEWADVGRAEHTDELLTWADKLTFFHQQKAADYGSQATFLGVELSGADGTDAASSLSWSALAVGDCCLLTWKRGSDSPSASWPFKDPDEFDRSPAVVGSFEKHGPTPTEIRISSSELAADEMLLLATDASAKRLLTPQPPFDPWQAWDWDGEAFGNWLINSRLNGEIENDDVTVVLVCRVPDAEPDGNEATGLHRVEFEEADIVPPPAPTPPTGPVAVVLAPPVQNAPSSPAGEDPNPVPTQQPDIEQPIPDEIGSLKAKVAELEKLHLAATTVAHRRAEIILEQDERLASLKAELERTQAELDALAEQPSQKTTYAEEKDCATSSQEGVNSAMKPSRPQDAGTPASLLTRGLEEMTSPAEGKSNMTESPAEATTSNKSSNTFVSKIKAVIWPQLESPKR